MKTTASPEIDPRANYNENIDFNYISIDLLLCVVSMISSQVFPLAAVTSLCPILFLIIALTFLGVKIAECVGSEIENTF